MADRGSGLDDTGGGANFDFWEELWRGQRAALGDVPNKPFLEWFELNWEISIRYWTEFLNRYATGRRMLECGGATGRLPLHLTRQGWHCTLVDITTEGPRLARARFRHGQCNAWFITGDVCSLPFANETFDVVYSNGLLDVLPDITTAIREMTRVLRPGGLFVAATNPRRCSVQTIAEGLLSLERRARHACSPRQWVRRLLRQSPEQDHRPPRAVAPFRNNFSLAAHMVACTQTGLHNVHGHGVGLLPVVAFPGPLMRGYLHLTRALVPLCLRFNRSASAWTAKWGVMLAIYGFK